MVNGVHVPCVVDSGSEVSTVTESFFYKYLHNDNLPLNPAHTWLTLTAANGLSIPYSGYFEADVDVAGTVLHNRGILVIKDPPGSSHKTPGLLGMNVLSLLKTNSSDKSWASILNITASSETGKAGVAKVAGRDDVLIPAGSVTVLRVVGARTEFHGHDVVVTPLVHQTVKDLMVVPTLGEVQFGTVPVRVANLGKDDVWLKPRTAVGVIDLADDVQAKEAVVWRQVTSTEIQLDIETPPTHQPLTTVNPGCPVDLSDVDCTHQQKQQLTQLLSKHADAFAKDDDDVGHTATTHHSIKLTDDIPINQPVRRIHPNQLAEVKSHIDKLLKRGVIQESSSPYASPIVLVRKKDQSLRLCVDYRKLNAKTIKDAFPLPRIDESFDALKDAQWFSIMDLVTGYNQVAMDPVDKPKTAFCSPFRL